jgi:hypothetical protein
MNFAAAERVADAVLYEGYILYPYRASAAKNRFRWQFGVVVPAGYAAADASEAASIRTECLLEGDERATLHVRLRFLRLEARRVEVPSSEAPARFEAVEAHRVGDQDLVTWDVGVLHVTDVGGLRIADLLAREHVEPIDLPGMEITELVRDDLGQIRARVVRERRPIAANVRVSAIHDAGWTRVSVTLENVSEWPAGRPRNREEALRQSCAGAHVLLAAEAAAFVSLTDPPPGAADAAAACRNERLWPVLVGPQGCRDLVLASPIILSDHPHIAPESPGDLCDATEIDEILTLRIMTLTDDEKREAYVTDDRARQIVERADTLPPGAFERLHGAIRQSGTAGAFAHDLADAEGFFNPPGAAPIGAEVVQVDGARVGAGSHVRLHPNRRADTMDMFLQGREATVAGVYRDVEDRAYVAVTIDDDPAADIQHRAGRFFYFYPDELEPLDEGRRDGRHVEKQV